MQLQPIWWSNLMIILFKPLNTKSKQSGLNTNNKLNVYAYPSSHDEIMFYFITEELT